MKKTVRSVVYAGIALLAAGLLAFVALKLYLTPERIKKYALEFASRNLNREIRLADASLSLGGIRLEGLAVSEYPDFKKGEFFTARSIGVRPSFRALLRKEVKINSLSAEGLVLRIAQVKPDAFNFSDLLAPAAGPGAGKEAAPSGAAPMTLDISAVSVKDSELSYRNLDNSMTVVLKKIDLDISSLSGDEPFPVEAGFELGLKTAFLKGEFPLYVKGRAELAGWNFEKAKAAIEKGRFAMGGVKCEFSGDLTDYFEPDARLALNVKEFSSGDLKRFYPAMPPGILLPAMSVRSDFKMTAKDLVFRTLEIKTGIAQGSLKGRLAWAPAFDYAFSAALKAQLPQMNTSDAAKTFPALPGGIKIPAVGLTAEAGLRPGSLNLKSFTLASGPVKAEGSADIDYAKMLKASGAIKIQDTDLGRAADMLPMLKDYALSGKAGADLKYAYSSKMSLSGGASFSDLGAKFADRTLSAFKGALSFSNDQITSGPMTGELDGENLKVNFSVRNWTDHPRAALDLTLARIVIKALPASQASGPEGRTAAQGKTPTAGKPFCFDLAGKAQIGRIEHPNFLGNNAVFKYDLRNIAEDLKLSGTASFDIEGGKFSNLYEFAQSFKAAKVALYPVLILQKASKLVKGLPLPDFNNISYTKITGDYLFQDGNMKIQRSDMNSDVADASSTGGINLPAETLDIKINTTLKEGIKTGAPVVINVKGTFSNPSAKPDIKSIVDQPAIKQGVEKLLRGFLKH
ncbi:MAG: AsmA family protein [Elusimicrobiales bacterium]|jgi:hypothetical protein